jgi:hypothetical protein
MDGRLCNVLARDQRRGSDVFAGLFRPKSRVVSDEFAVAQDVRINNLTISPGLALPPSEC